MFLLFLKRNTTINFNYFIVVGNFQYKKKICIYFLLVSGTYMIRFGLTWIVCSGFVEENRNKTQHVLSLAM